MKNKDLRTDAKMKTAVAKLKKNEEMGKVEKPPENKKTEDVRERSLECAKMMLQITEKDDPLNNEAIDHYKELIADLSKR